MENDLSKYDPFSDNYDPTLACSVPKPVTMCADCTEVMNGETIKKILEVLDGRKLLVLSIHGSKLYGLDHADSDLDMKGVFMPTEQELLLGTCPTTLKYKTGNDNEKNSKEDIDVELYSIHKFFQLAKEGDTNAISILNAPFDKICSRHPLWNEIIANANMFYSKNMQGLIGYVLKQTSNYCVKGDRLKAANESSNFFNDIESDVKLKDIWHLLPTGEFQFKVSKNGNNFYSVCERMIQDTSTIKYAKGVVLSIVKSYGKRAKQASDSNGLDWKAISHAFRVASELSNLYEFGMIKYPLNDFERIKRIKMGELDFKTEVQPQLNSLMDRVHKMSAKSNFPEFIDTGKVDDLFVSLIKKYYKF